MSCLPQRRSSSFRRWKHTGGRTLLSLLLVLTAAPQAVLAQSVTVPIPPVPSGVIPPPSNPIERVQPPGQPLITPPPAPPESAAPNPEAGPDLLVKSVDIDGATHYSPEELAQYYAPILNKTVPAGQIAAAADAIQTRYRRDGYFLSAARAAVTAEADGVKVRIHVTEGYIADVKIDGDIGPAGSKIYDYLQNLVGIRPVNIANVERYLLLAQGVPGVSVRAVLRPSGGEPGAVELVAQVARKEFGGLVNFDTRGPKTAGPSELLTSATANSFTSEGERTELDLFDTPFDPEQIFAQLSVSALVGSDGLEVRGYVGYGLTSPGNVLRNIGYKGRLNTGGVAADYPLIRSRALNLQLTSNFDFFQSEIDLFGPSGLRAREANSRLRVLRIGGVLNFQDTLLGAEMGGATTVTMQAHKAFDILHGSSNDAELLPRPGTVSDFIKYTGEIVRVQDLFSLDDYQFALKLAVAGQWTRSILPSSEEFFLGGNQYGRGFFNGEVTGDRALAETAELQVNTTVSNFITWFDEQPPDMALRYYAFFDNGQAWNNTSATPPQQIQSAGIGAKATVYPGYWVTLELDNRFTLRPSGGSAVSPLAPRVLIVEAGIQF